MRILPGDENKEGEGYSNVFALPLPKRIDDGATVDRQDDGGDSGYLITDGTVENPRLGKSFDTARLLGEAIGVLVVAISFCFILGLLIYASEFVINAWKNING